MQVHSIQAGNVIGLQLIGKSEAASSARHKVSVHLQSVTHCKPSCNHACRERHLCCSWPLSGAASGTHRRPSWSSARAATRCTCGRQTAHHACTSRSWPSMCSRRNGLPEGTPCCWRTETTFAVPTLDRWSSLPPDCKSLLGTRQSSRKRQCQLLSRSVGPAWLRRSFVGAGPSVQAPYCARSSQAS